MTDQTDTTNLEADDTALGGTAPDATDTATETTNDADKTTALGSDGADAGAQDAPVAPDAYDFEGIELPEGMEFDKEAFDALEPVLREMNMPQESANALVKGYTEKLVPLIEQRAMQQVDDQGDELRANLARQLQVDPEVGGKHLTESKAMAAKALAHALPNATDREAFNTFMNESGLGNHPMLMRVIAAFGRNLSEASTPAASGAEAGEPSIADIFYPKQG